MDELGLIFRGPGVAPDTLDAQHAMSVALAYINALVAVATYDWGVDYSPFTMTMVRIESSSVAFKFRHLPSAAKSDTYGRDMLEARANDAWRHAPRRLSEYARNADIGPKQLRPKLLTLFKHTRSLPSHISAAVETGESDAGTRWSWALTDAANQKPLPVAAERLSFRGVILTAGGKRPRVRISCKGGTDTFSVAASSELAQLAGTYLYKPVNITAKLVRTLEPPFSVVNGELHEIRGISSENAITAFDTWYRAIGRPLLNDGDGDGESSPIHG
jgi:hypothetical protein